MVTHKTLSDIERCPFLSMYVNRSVAFDVLHSAMDGETIDAQACVADAIRSYFKENPEEYDPRFQDFFTANELITMSRSLQEAV